LYDKATDCAVSQTETVTISPKYQVVIPKDVRESLGLEPGQKVMVMPYAGRAMIVPVEEPRDLRGMAPGIDTTVEREPDRL
jgi:AbrB family looped-hinge helix DNA binding protein